MLKLVLFYSLLDKIIFDIKLIGFPWTPSKGTVGGVGQVGAKNNNCPIKPYRTPPSSNIQSSATQKCCGVVFFFCIIFLYSTFFFNWKIRYFACEIFYPLLLHLYRNVIPQNLNSLLRLVVAKWTFAVWFHAIIVDNFVSLSLLFSFSMFKLFIAKTKCNQKQKFLEINMMEICCCAISAFHLIFSSIVHTVIPWKKWQHFMVLSCKMQ